MSNHEEFSQIFPIVLYGIQILLPFSDAFVRETEFGLFMHFYLVVRKLLFLLQLYFSKYAHKKELVK